MNGKNEEHVRETRERYNGSALLFVAWAHWECRAVPGGNIDITLKLYGCYAFSTCSPCHRGEQYRLSWALLETQRTRTKANVYIWLCVCVRSYAIHVIIFILLQNHFSYL